MIEWYVAVFETFELNSWNKNIDFGNFSVVSKTGENKNCQPSRSAQHHCFTNTKAKSNTNAKTNTNVIRNSRARQTQKQWKTQRQSQMQRRRQTQTQRQLQT